MNAKEEALKAINKVHQNMTCSLQVLNDLQELQEHIEFLVGAVEEDIDREEKA